MYLLVAMMSALLLATIGIGLYLQARPPSPDSRLLATLKRGVAGNLIVFIAAQIGLLVLGIGEVMAQTPTTAATLNASTGYGLGLIGVGIPTGLAAIGAGIAVGPVGAAALAVVAEKPEAFGRTLVYLGLAEGIAIYGLVMSILMLGKL